MSSTASEVPIPAGPPAPAAVSPSLADAAPTGLACFAITTFLLSMVNANFVTPVIQPMVLGVALMVGGIAQFAAGMWEFRAGNTFGGMLFTVFGGFWLALWAIVQFYVKEIPPREVGNALGLFLIAFAMFTLIMFVASLKTTRAATVVLGLLFITFLLLGIGNAGTHTTIIHWGGYFGLVTAAGAGYIALAGVTNETFGRTVLPVWPVE
jgi:uncharacterized protein